MAGIPSSELRKLNPNTFDMENILTRAVHRVLSNNFYDSTNNSVEKPKVHFQSTNNQAHVRLIADQLCRRVERRYERKLENELEKERGRMERKLAQIREEYRSELEQKKKDVEHERLVMEERVRERERSLQHMMDIRAMDKEGSLDLQRKLLENRHTEMKLAAERLERANDEFKKRMKTELEGLRLEWERLALKEAEMGNTEKNLAETRVVQEMRGNIEIVTKENEELKRRIARMEREKTEADRRMEEDLRLTLNRVRDGESLGKSVLVKEILEQNTKLKEDLLKNEMRSRADVGNELGRMRNEYDRREEGHLLKIKEQQQIIQLMNNRLKHLQAEKNYLKKELKETRTEMFYGEAKKGKRTKKREKEESSFLESLSSSSESSSLSNGSIEIANIKKRISSLDQMAKQLDASVEMFTMTSTHKRHLALEEDTFHGYDDFCRGIIMNGSHQNSPVKPISQPETKEPAREIPQPIFETRSTLEKHGTKPIEQPQPKVEEESEFARRLRERNEQLNKRTLTLASEETLKEEAVSQENLLFKPTSSTMADYMNMFAQPSTKSQFPSSSPPEIVLPEEVQLDPVTKSDDDIDW